MDAGLSSGGEEFPSVEVDLKATATHVLLAIAAIPTAAEPYRPASGTRVEATTCYRTHVAIYPVPLRGGDPFAATTSRGFCSPRGDTTRIAAYRAQIAVYPVPDV